MRAAGLPICGTLAVLAVCMAPAPAAAATVSGLEPGVHVDPGSPAEKQYVLPLNQARQTGNESSSHQSSGSGLFGAGITPPRGGAGTGGSARSGAGAHSGAAPGHHALRKGSPAGGGSAGAGATSPSTALPAAVLRAARAQDSSAGSGSWLALLGGGLAVLVLGGFGGTVLRHSRRPTPSS